MAELPISLLRAVLEESYSLDIVAIEPSRSGMMAAAYVASDSSGRRWWLNVRPHIPCWPMPKAQLDAALQQTIELRNQVHHAGVVTPLLSKVGEPTAAAGEHLLSVYPYLELRPIGHRTTWPDDLLRMVAYAMAEIHSAALTGSDLHAEDFALWPRESLTDGFAALAALSPGAIRPGQRRAQEVAAAMERDLCALLESYAQAQQYIDRRSELVPCHMDLTPNNVTLDTDGLVQIVDWDQFQLAPPEFDLRWLLHLGRYDIALDAYESAGGRFDLDPRMFAFYFHRRCLAEELACNVASLLLPDRTDEQDAEEVRQLESIVWAFDGGMQRWVREVENGLAARKRGHGSTRP